MQDINSIPDDILNVILDFLDSPQDLAACATLNKRFHSLIKNNLVPQKYLGFSLTDFKQVFAIKKAASNTSNAGQKKNETQYNRALLAQYTWHKKLLPLLPTTQKEFAQAIQIEKFLLNDYFLQLGDEQAKQKRITTFKEKFPFLAQTSPLEASSAWQAYFTFLIKSLNDTSINSHVNMLIAIIDESKFKIEGPSQQAIFKQGLLSLIAIHSKLLSNLNPKIFSGKEVAPNINALSQFQNLLFTTLQHLQNICQDKNFNKNLSACFSTLLEEITADSGVFYLNWCKKLSKKGYHSPTMSAIGYALHSEGEPALHFLLAPKNTALFNFRSFADFIYWFDSNIKNIPDPASSSTSTLLLLSQVIKNFAEQNIHAEAHYLFLLFIAEIYRYGSSYPYEALGRRLFDFLNLEPNHALELVIRKTIFDYLSKKQGENYQNYHIENEARIGKVLTQIIGKKTTDYKLNTTKPNRDALTEVRTYIKDTLQWLTEKAATSPGCWLVIKEVQALTCGTNSAQIKLVLESDKEPINFKKLEQLYGTPGLLPRLQAAFAEKIADEKYYANKEGKANSNIQIFCEAVTWYLRQLNHIKDSANFPWYYNNFAFEMAKYLFLKQQQADHELPKDWLANLDTINILHSFSQTPLGKKHNFEAILAQHQAIISNIEAKDKIKQDVITLKTTAADTLKLTKNLGSLTSNLSQSFFVDPEKLAKLQRKLTKANALLMEITTSETKTEEAEQQSTKKIKLN